jgi:hypothetical protein
VHTIYKDTVELFIEEEEEEEEEEENIVMDSGIENDWDSFKTTVLTWID